MTLMLLATTAVTTATANTSGTIKSIAMNNQVSSNPRRYDVFVATDIFEVLDIDFEGGRVAFKHVFHKIGEDQLTPALPVNCGYAGMQKFPTSGVVLGVYDCRRDELSEYFVVYRAATQRGDCTSHDESAQTLARAKARLKQLGLSITRRPKGTTPIADGDTARFAIKTSAGPVSLAASSRRLADQDWDSNPVLAERDRASLPDGMITIGEIRNDKQEIVYRRYHDDYWNMGSGGRLVFVSAYTDGDTTVFMERFHHHNRFEGQVDQEIYYFSTPIRLR